MDTSIMSLKVFIVSIVFILHINVTINAQESFLLNAKNMKEYKLIRQVNTLWQVSADSLKMNVIEQKWKISERDEYYINYCEFEGEEDAIKGTAYAANSCAIPFIFGSPTGEIIGDASWVAIDRSAVYFQKGNIGIKIFKPVNLKPEDYNIVLNLSNKVLVKITENIPSNIKTKEKELLKYQLSYADYQKITEQSNVLLTQNGYVEYIIENSKWLVKEDSLVMGFRKQWSKDQSIISIDIAKYSNVIDAQNAIEYRGIMFVCPLCILDNNESISAAIDEWLEKWGRLNTLNYISIIGRSGKTSVHFYYYNTDGIDTNKIYKIIEAINII